MVAGWTRDSFRIAELRTWMVVAKGNQDLVTQNLDSSKDRNGFISIISINNLSRVKLGED